MPAVAGAKLVEMLFVKSSFFIQCIMKLVASDIGITGFIQVDYKSIHDGEETVFVYIVMASVQPVNDVAS